VTTPITIFVFGSNLAGVHGAGAALYAKQKYGAQLRVGVGRTGYAYAIPTKDHQIKTLPLDQIKPHVDEFIRYAKANPQYVFQVTRIGCGLAGYTDEDIAPMFKDAPSNCGLDPKWVKIINDMLVSHIQDILASQPEP
jgi:galactokinase/mevalonate kinase-like predicted kinase